MRHRENFTKLFIVGLIIVFSLAAIMFLRDRFGMGMGIFSKDNQKSAHADLVIINDLSDSMSVEYKEGDKGISPVVQPGAKISGGEGFIRVFTAEKGGSYEVEYEYPRPAGSPQEVAVSQLIEAAKKDKVEGVILFKEGMLGDIKVEYEEPLELDVTY